MKNFLTGHGIILVCIIAVAFFIRIWNISNVPPSLNWDEVSHGYNAYSILKTGRDEWGEYFPTIFRAYGDNKLPVYIYSVIPSILILGLNEIGVRFPSVLAGTFTILFTYLLTKEVFLKHARAKQIATLAAMLVAIEPWTFFVSRGAFEANMALFLITAGAYCLFRSFKNPPYIILSAISFGLSVWTYNSARIFVPLLLIVFALLYKDKLAIIYKKSKSISLVSLIVLGIFILTMLFQLANPVGQARYEKVSILDEGAISQINEERRISNYPESLKRLRYNKLTFIVDRFTKNMISHFSFSYLYKNGGTHYQFSLQNHGVLYIVNAAFMFLGFVILLILRKKNYLMLIIWLFIGAVASSLTREAPHVLRSITMLPIPMIITAYGVISFYYILINKIKQLKKYRYLFVVVYAVAVIISARDYMFKYFTDYPRDYSLAWQYGYKEVISYINENYFKYDKIIFTKKYGEPHEFILFYSNWNPEEYRNDNNLVRFTQSNWWWVDAFDKFVFINEWQMREKVSQNSFVTESKSEYDCTNIRCLVISSKENSPIGWNKLEEYKFLDGTTVFEIYEN